MKFDIKKRQMVFKSLKKDLGINSDLPEDFDGVPSSMAQKAWLISYKSDRDQKDIPTLWNLFEATLESNITNSLFNSALEIHQVGFSKLTQGLFWVRPRFYFPIDNQTKPFLDKNSIDYSCAKSKSYSDYVECLEEIRNKFRNETFHELSHKAWLENQDVAPSKKLKQKDNLVSSIRYWTYSPGKDAQFWDSHYEKGIMTIGWDFLGDLKLIPDKNEIRSRMQFNYKDKSSHKNRVLACYDFCHTLKKGDIIFAKRGKSELLGYGTIESDYIFDDSRPKHKNVRNVNWSKKGSWDISKNQSALKTLTDITKNTDFVDALKKIVAINATGQDPTIEKSDDNHEVKPYPVESSLETLFITESKFYTILKRITVKKNSDCIGFWGPR